MQAYENYESDIREGRKPILVDCTDPARSAHVESCIFPPSDLRDAIDDFCDYWELEPSQVNAVEIEGEDHAAILAVRI